MRFVKIILIVVGICISFVILLIFLSFILLFLSPPEKNSNISIKEISQAELPSLSRPEFCGNAVWNGIYCKVVCIDGKYSLQAFSGGEVWPRIDKRNLSPRCWNFIEAYPSMSPLNIGYFLRAEEKHPSQVIVLDEAPAFNAPPICQEHDKLPKLPYERSGEPMISAPLTFAREKIVISCEKSGSLLFARNAETGEVVHYFGKNSIPYAVGVLRKDGYEALFIARKGINYENNAFFEVFNQSYKCVLSVKVKGRTWRVVSPPNKPDALLLYYGDLAEIIRGYEICLLGNPTP